LKNINNIFILVFDVIYSNIFHWSRIIEMANNVDNQLLIKIFWTNENDEEGRRVCRFCSCKRKFNRGGTNLLSHIKEKHEHDYMDIYNRHRNVDGPMDLLCERLVSEKAKNISSWMEWIVMRDQPFSIVEDTVVLKFTKLQPISRPTLMKYFERTLNKVQQKIRENLPDSFGLIMDGWSLECDHYIAVFGTWVNSTGAVVTRLLSCGVQDLPTNSDEAKDFGFTAEDLGDYIYDVLQRYGKDWQSIEFITGDNAAVNLRIADLISAALRGQGIERRIPLVGCASHKLNLAVQSIYGPGTKYERIVRSIDELMSELRTLKNSARLAMKTKLVPERRNVTRWGSTFAMLSKYLKLYPFIMECIEERIFSVSITELVPNPTQHALVVELVELLKKFEAVSLHLQKDDATLNSLCHARLLFDKLVEVTKNDSVEHYLGPNAQIVHSPNFEKAIIKIQSSQESTMNAAERKSVSLFKNKPSDRSSSFDPDIEEVAIDFVSDAINSQKRKVNASEYKSVAHIAVTSNIVERLFSRCNLVMRPTRRRMDPSTLEMLMILRMNNDMWDARIIDELEKAK
jgi:hypothetical protein